MAPEDLRAIIQGLRQKFETDHINFVEEFGKAEAFRTVDRFLEKPDR